MSALERFLTLTGSLVTDLRPFVHHLYTLSLGIEFVFWFWENQKGKLEIFEEACCSTTFEAAALAQYWGETANLLAAAFEIPKSGKQ